MEFSWWIFAVILTVNCFYMGLMYLLQELDRNLSSRHSTIPGTKQKFLYMQDFYTMIWGDFIAVPLIVNAFVHLALHGLSLAEWVLFFTVIVVDAFGFLWLCTRSSHKPDQGFPEVGKVSWHGLAHLPYHGVVVAISIILIWHIFIDNLHGSILYTSLMGGVLYIVSFIADIISGNFDRLKKFS